MYNDFNVDMHMHHYNYRLACMQLASCGQCCMRDHLNLLLGEGGGWTMRGQHDVDVIGKLSDP